MPIDTAGIGGLNAMALSPDGSAVALEIVRPTDPDNFSRIWVKDLAGGPTQLVTSENRSSYSPVWTPDGRDVLFTSDLGEAMYRRRADGSGAAELVARLPRGTVGVAIHPDGKTMVVRVVASGAKRGELLKIQLGTDSAPKPLFADAGGESSPAFSPDGRWLAYASDESGRPEVYIRPFPDLNTRKIQVSREGGAAPRWNPNGGELFYLSGAGDMMAARLATTPTLKVTGVSRLFTPQGFQVGTDGLLYEVGRDSLRFLLLDISATPADASDERLVVVLNIGAELAKRLNQ